MTYNTEKAETIILGFGSTYGVIREAVDRDPSAKLGCIHLPQVWPFPTQALQNILGEQKKIYTLENNAGAQLAKLLRRETGLQVKGSILKYDGRPFDLDYVQKKLKEAGAL